MFSHNGKLFSRTFTAEQAKQLQFIHRFAVRVPPAFRRGEESQLSFFHITHNVVILEI